MRTDPSPADATSRRAFLTYFSSAGLGSTLLPGALWAEMRRQEAQDVTARMVKDAAWLTGLELTDELTVTG